MFNVAERLLECFDTEDGRICFVTFKGEDYERLSVLLHSLNVGEDTAYEEIVAALDSIAKEGTEHIEDNIYYYCESDVYTNDLLKWASANLDNIAWCNEAMAQQGSFDNFVDILMAGQAMAKQHVWAAVIDLVREMELKIE